MDKVKLYILKGGIGSLWDPTQTKVANQKILPKRAYNLERTNKVLKAIRNDVLDIYEKTKGDGVIIIDPDKSFAEQQGNPVVESKESKLQSEIKVLEEENFNSLATIEDLTLKGETLTKEVVALKAKIAKIEKPKAK